jgi:arabinofuranan 3-O-arabinosyltransferase
MAAGHNSVVELTADAFSVQAVTMTGPGTSVAAGPGPAARAAKVLTWTASRRVLQVAASQPSYLIVNENFNAGWQAAVHGRSLQPVRLDGWKQGWLLPAGSRGLVTLTYRPDAQYRAALFTGLGALGLILLFAAVPFRRRQGIVPVTDGEPQARSVAAAGAASGPASASDAAPALTPAPAAAPALTPAPAAAPARTAPPASARAWVWGVAVLLAGLLGLWTGGYVGLVLLPLMTVGFMMAIARRPRSRFAGWVAEPWLIAALLTIAGVSGALGNELYTHGIFGVPLVALGGVVPELACLAIAGRVLAALLAPDA